MAGMLVGFAVWAYTLFLPSFLEGNPTGLLLLQHGPFGIEALRPRALFGADLPPLLHGVQLWVALPDAVRNQEPAFQSYADLPDLNRPGVRGKVLVGEAISGCRRRGLNPVQCWFAV